MKNKKWIDKKITNKSGIAQIEAEISNKKQPQKTYTEDLKDFGAREYQELQKILNAWFNGKGLPRYFEYNNVRPAFNLSSAYVFLVNDDYQVAMLNGEDLELFYSCPECGNEGFEEDLGGECSNDCCKKYIKEIKA